MSERAAAEGGGGSLLSRRWFKWLVVCAGAVLAVWLVKTVWSHDAPMEWLRSARPLPFFALMAVLPLIGVPMMPLFVLAGASFGGWLGVLGSLAALAANLGLTYAVARLLRSPLEAVLRRAGHPLPDLGAQGQSPIRATLAVKLAPAVPAFVKHYGLALAGVPFWPYFLLSLLVTGTYGTAVVLVGGSLFEHRAGPPLLVAASAALVLFLAWRWWRSRSEPPDRPVEVAHG